MHNKKYILTLLLSVLVIIYITQTKPHFLEETTPENQIIPLKTTHTLTPKEITALFYKQLLEETNSNNTHPIDQTSTSYINKQPFSKDLKTKMITYWTHVALCTNNYENNIDICNDPQLDGNPYVCGQDAPEYEKFTFENTEQAENYAWIKVSELGWNNSWKVKLIQENNNWVINKIECSTP